MKHNYRRKRVQDKDMTVEANPGVPAHNGYRPSKVRPGYRVGQNRRYLDKSMHGWGRKTSEGEVVCAGIGNDFTNGHRGMAKAVRGAKKFVRSRIRTREKIIARKATERHFADQE
jgi:hypothetical protein